MIVLDASLAVKLIVRESDSVLAHRWYREAGSAVIAPDILAIEVAQAIVRRVNMREMMVPAGRAAIREWRVILDSGAIELIRTLPAQVEAAAELAVLLGHPVKDCVYLSLANQMASDLVTCDVRFAAKASPHHSNVKLLADYA